MPDLRDDTTDDGFHEIQFSSKQLVFLFMAASVILIFVFLAGVLVGRDTTSKEPEVSIASDQSAGTQSTLPEDPTPIAAQDPAGAPPADPLSYPTVLTDKTSDVPAAPKPAVEPQAAAPAEETKAPAVKPDAPVSRPADAGLNVPTSGKPGQWVIQVAALKTRRAAAESVQRLIGKGYDAYLEDTAKGLYRVRIGKFRDRDDALRVARRLEKEEGTKSVVSR